MALVAEGEFLSSAVLTAVQNQPTVLLVEDEEMVRKLLFEALRRAGYKVVACCDADEALQASGQLGQQIDLLLTDVAMPGMSGTEMAQRIQRIQPQLRVLFMSGHPQSSVSAPGQLDDLGYLQKPFTLKALTQTLANALQRTHVGEG